MLQSFAPMFYRVKSLVLMFQSISPGLVATELLKANYEATGCKPTVDAEEERSRPLLNPKDVADAVIYALAAPAHVQIHDIIIRPVGEVF